MKIKQYRWNVVDSNSWLISEGKHGLLIDAVDNQSLYEDIKGLETLVIILTHAHFDHIIGLNEIRSIRPDATTISTEKCSVFLGNVYRNMSATAIAFMHFYKDGQLSKVDIHPFTCDQADNCFSDKMVLSWHGHEIELVAVHGHSEDGLIVILDQKQLFSGDTLLHTPTVTRFPTGSTKAFREEDSRILKGLKATLVYPGHGIPSRLDRLLAINGI